jgi:hypothetical protein
VLVLMAKYFLILNLLHLLSSNAHKVLATTYN